MINKIFDYKILLIVLLSFILLATFFVLVFTSSNNVAFANDSFSVNDSIVLGTSKLYLNPDSTSFNTWLSSVNTDTTLFTFGGDVGVFVAIKDGNKILFVGVDTLYILYATGSGVYEGISYSSGYNLSLLDSSYGFGYINPMPSEYIGYTFTINFVDSGSWNGTILSPSSFSGGVEPEPVIPITNLSGYYWVANDTIDFSYATFENNYSSNYDVNFIASKNDTFLDMRLINLIDFGDVQALRFKENVSGSSMVGTLFYSSSDGYASSDFDKKYIRFIDGEDISDSDLIYFLYYNGTFIDSLYDVGYDTGYDVGYDTGYDNGLLDNTLLNYDGSFYNYSVESDYYDITDTSSFVSNTSFINSSTTITYDVPSIYFVIDGVSYGFSSCSAIYSDVGSYTCNVISYSSSFACIRIVNKKPQPDSSIDSDYVPLPLLIYNSIDSFDIIIESFDSNSVVVSRIKTSIRLDGVINNFPYMNIKEFIPRLGGTYSVYLCSKDVGDTLVLHNSVPVLGIVPNNVYLNNYTTLQYDNGYNDGVDYGKSVGYINGYNDGVNDSNNNNFFGLFSAVIDAPVSAIANSLNFNLLGFNMRDFFFTLISLAIVLFVVRLFLS